VGFCGANIGIFFEIAPISAQKSLFIYLFFTLIKVLAPLFSADK
jgi:hypothetical protein